MIVVTDYIGHSDKQGKPMGHPIKVVNEMIDLLKDLTEVAVAVPAAHREQIHHFEGRKVHLPNYICTYSTEKIENFKKKWQNLHTLFQKTKGTPLFINVDFSLFLYLYLFAANRKVWITLCYNPLKKAPAWRRKIIEAVLKRAEVVIVTNKLFCEAVPGNTVFIPDYYYRTDFYKQYEQEKNALDMVCLGTMGPTKKLEALVRTMNGTVMQLKILGNFASAPERFEKLKKMAQSNVSVESRYVEMDEYYRLIGTSAYTVLPYDMTLYDERTSGILLESAFLGSIPVAPQKLLDYNGIRGLGYEEISDIPDLLKDAGDCAEIREYNNLLRTERFSMQSVRNVLKQYIS